MQTVSADHPQEIFVTAERRPEKPENVPISLTVLTRAELKRSDLTMATLGKLAPSLVMTRSGAFTQPFLRGVGKRSTLGIENNVATYVDGIYLASSISLLLGLRGADRVEVLNGPQGTLFGRNTTGGVIQVVTRDPSPGRSAETELHVGSYGQVSGNSYLSGGTDALSTNLAISLDRNDGYGTNVYTGKKDQGAVRHSLAGRTKWLWRPAQAVELTLAADYQDVDQDFTQLPLIGFRPIGEPRIQSFRDSDQDFPSRYRFRYGGLSLKTAYASANFKLISLTAARWMHARYGADLDAGPRLLLSAAPVADQKQLSQEFQLQSIGAAKLKWTAGLYFIHIDERYDPTNFTYGGTYSERLGGRLEQTLFDVGKLSSYAAYGQATLGLRENSNLTAGLRYTIEQRSVRARGQQLYDNPPFVRPIPGLPLLTDQPFRNSETFRELTWRASFDRHFAKGLMGYVSVSRGFQSGGWNLQTPQSPPFLPETLDAFEAGLKYAAPSGRIRADASAFYYNYSDLQVSIFTPLGSRTTNAASARIYGIEVQLELQANRSTDFTFGAQLLHARYDEFRNATCINYDPDATVPYAPGSCDASGNRLPFAPALKLNTGASHAISLGSRGRLVLSGNLAYNSGYFSEPDNVVRQKPYATLDLSAEWRPADPRTTLRLWIANVTDAHYFESLATFPTTGVFQRPAAPRRFGASIGYAI